MALFRRLLDKTGLFPFAERIYFRWIAFKRVWNVRVFLPLMVRVPLFRRMWYGFFSGVFSHEIAMYVKARLVYYRGMEGAQGNMPLLRRNIHRLEKGLLMVPRKPVFAVDYISETVSEYLKVKQNFPESSVLDWADDVLTSYFSVVAPHPVADCARERYFQNRTKPAGCALEFVPFQAEALVEERRRELEDSLNELLARRKSVRVFQAGRIPARDLIDKAVLMASNSPSSCNRQPFEFRFFDDPALVKQLSAIPGGAKGFSAGIPVLCAVVGKMDVSPSPGDRHLIYIDGSLAAMTLMLALESLGVATCALNWPDNHDLESAFRKVVDMEEYERPIMLMAIGYADDAGLVAFSRRKSLDEIRKYN